MGRELRQQGHRDQERHQRDALPDRFDDAGAGFSGLPSGAAIDTWISDEGFLVGLEASGFPGGDMSIQVSNVDDPANKVDRPS